MRCRLLLLTFMLAFPVAAPGGQTAAPATLQFDWPRDLTATIETERTRERRAGATTSTTVRASYRMTVSPHAEGLLVKYDQFKVPGSAGDAAAAVEALSMLVPNLIVSTDGAFRRVEDLGPMKAAVHALLGSISGKGNVPAGLKTLLAQLGSDEVLSNLAASEWQVLIETWRDFPLAAGRFEQRAEQPSPILPDVRIPMTVTGQMIERIDCVRGGVRLECGVFETRSAVDQAAMEPIMKRLMEGVAGMQTVTYERLDVVSTARVRLETRTMVPHELATSRTVTMVATGPDGQRMNATQTDRRTWTFSY
jgi:hypothetical protein